MVTHDSFDRFFAFHGLLLWPEELHPYSLTQRIEVLIQEKFLHFLVDRGQLLNQHAPHDVLVFFISDVFLLPVENLSEGVFEASI